MYNIYIDDVLYAVTYDKTFVITGLRAGAIYKVGVSRTIKGVESEVTETYVNTLPQIFEDLPLDIKRPIATRKQIKVNLEASM